MCRLCGRVVKCIFDSMPSRIHHVPSRRAFSTIRRSTISMTRATSIQHKPASVQSLSRTFSSLTIRPHSTSILFSTITRPSLATLQPQTISQTTPQSREFSSSATLGAARDTYNPSRRVQKRRHGYLARTRSRGGQGVLKRRRIKKRVNLTW